MTYKRDDEELAWRYFRPDAPTLTDLSSSSVDAVRDGQQLEDSFVVLPSSRNLPRATQKHIKGTVAVTVLPTGLVLLNCYVRYC